MRKYIMHRGRLQFMLMYEIMRAARIHYIAHKIARIKHDFKAGRINTQTMMRRLDKAIKGLTKGTTDYGRA